MRRILSGVVLLAAVVLWASLGAVAQESQGRGEDATTPAAGCGQDKTAEIERDVAYGNYGRWEWHHGWWWWMMQHDHRYPAVGDLRRRCGNTGTTAIRSDHVRSTQLRGHCQALPGRPGWYRVALTRGDLAIADRFTPDAKVVAFENMETLKEPGPEDSTKPPAAR